MYYYGSILLLYGGSVLVDMIYYENVVYVMWLVSQEVCDKLFFGCVYNIINGEYCILCSIVQKLIDELNIDCCICFVFYLMLDMIVCSMECLGCKLVKELLLIYYGVFKLNFDFMLDIMCVQEELGYQLVIILDEGIEKIVVWLCDYGKLLC